jgi:predicted transcriptional regulator
VSMTARIADFMTPHPITLNQWETVGRAREIFLEYGFNILPIVDDEGRLCGKISARELPMPTEEEEDVVDDQHLAHVMSDRVLTAHSTATVADAAVSMTSHHVHHLIVVDLAHRPIGVVSTLDVATALVDAELEEEVAALMTTDIVTVDAGTTVGDALEAMDDASISAAVVQDGVGQYSGILTRLSLLGVDPDDRVDQVMEPNVDYIDADATVTDVARAVAEDGVRRLLVVDESGMVQGIVTPSDLIRYAAGLSEYEGPSGGEGDEAEGLEVIPYGPEDTGEEDEY